MADKKQHTRYIDICTLTVNMADPLYLKTLYTIANQNKVDAVTFFVDSNDMFICFDSYITNTVVVHKVSCQIKEIIVKDQNNNQITVKIDNTKYLDKSKYKADNTNPAQILEEVNENLDRKTYLRFMTTTNILKALSFYSNQMIVLDVNESVTLSEGITYLTFNKPRTFVKLGDYLNQFINISWDELNINVVNSIAKALIKTKDTVYKQYIALKGDRIYSHNTSFLLEQKSNTVKGSYILPYIAIGILKTIPNTAKTMISKKDVYLNISSADRMFISWNVGKIVEETDNLMTNLNRNNFIRLLSVNKSEWDKVTVLKDYSSVDSDQDVVLTTANNSFNASKGDNRTTMKASTTKTEVSFKW